MDERSSSDRRIAFISRYLKGGASSYLVRLLAAGPLLLGWVYLSLGLVITLDIQVPRWASPILGLAKAYLVYLGFGLGLLWVKAGNSVKWLRNTGWLTLAFVQQIVLSFVFFQIIYFASDFFSLEMGSAGASLASTALALALSCLLGLWCFASLESGDSKGYAAFWISVSLFFAHPALTVAALIAISAAFLIIPGLLLFGAHFEIPTVLFIFFFCLLPVFWAWGIALYWWFAGRLRKESANSRINASR